MSEINATVVGENQPVSGPNDSPLSGFSGLKQKAAELLDAELAKPSAPVVAEPPAPPATKVAEAEQPAAVEPVTEVEAAAAAALALKDDDLVEVMVDGQPEQLSWKEAKGKISGGLKFTKNMQQVAQERKALEADKASVDALKAEHAQLTAFLNNPEAVVRYVASQYPQLFVQPSAAPNGQPAPQNPDELASIGDVRQVAREQAEAVMREMANVRAETEQRIAAAKEEIAFRQEVAKHSVVVNSTLADIFTKNPVLQAIPNAEELIRYQVAQLNPQSEAEALEAFHTVSNGIVEEINKHSKVIEKAQKITAAKAKLEASSIEPPGGAAPQQKPISYKNADGSLNWGKVRDAASAYLANQ